MWIFLCFLCASALEEVIVKLASGGHIGLSTRGPSAFRVRFLFHDYAAIETPMVQPDEGDAQFEKTSSSRGTGISASFGSLLVGRQDAAEASTSCFLLLNSDGKILTQSLPLKRGAAISLSTSEGELYGRGASPDDATELVATSVVPWMRNKAAYTPHYYSTDGYAALGVSNTTKTEASAFGLFTLDTTAYLGVSYSSNRKHIAWQYEDGAFELYFMPASTLDAGTRAYFALCGAPRIPPRFAFGFLASRWGWKNRNGTEDVLVKFRTDDYPLDAYIADFEWFAPIPDYLLPSWGADWYHDFGYERTFFPSPKQDMHHDLSVLHTYFGGIRKPRLGNSGFLKMAWSKGWTLPGGFEERSVLFLCIVWIVLIVFAVSYAALTLSLCVACKRRCCDKRQHDQMLEVEASYFVDSSQGESACQTSVSFRSRILHFARPCSCCCLLLWIVWLMLLAVLVCSSMFVAMNWKNRNLDFSLAEVREWYASKLSDYIDDGVAFWWNDEGETNYFTYHWWNVAEIEALRRKFAKKRFYSINRGFSPGMARLGASVWTGDISPSWDDLARTPGMMLNWGLAGAPYVACDIGGFFGLFRFTDATLLTRWYQMGIFLPTMRIHSHLLSTPHFPWLWGEAPGAAMRKALELRYRLVPYHYSLAHAMFRKRILWMRPLVMEFPDDPASKSITSEWMDGMLLVAPIIRKDSEKHIYLPAGKWYRLNGTYSDSAFDGPTHLHGVAALDEVPVFIRAGGVVPLAPTVQYTDGLPGGPLEVQVYAGVDGSFDLVEDDGTTTNYEKNEVRTTKLFWDDSVEVFSWNASGTIPDHHAFTHLFVTLFNGKGVKRSETKAIGRSGSIELRSLRYLHWPDAPIRRFST